MFKSYDPDKHCGVLNEQIDPQTGLKMTEPCLRSLTCKVSWSSILFYRFLLHFSIWIYRWILKFEFDIESTMSSNFILVFLNFWNQNKLWKPIFSVRKIWLQLYFLGFAPNCSFNHLKKVDTRKKFFRKSKKKVKKNRW